MDRHEVSSRDELNKAVSASGRNPRQLHHIVYDDYECGIGTAMSIAKLFNVSFYEVLRNLGYELPTVQVVGEIELTGLIVPKKLPPVTAPVSVTPDTCAAVVGSAAGGGLAGTVVFWEYVRYRLPEDHKRLVSAQVVIQTLPDARGETQELVGSILDVPAADTIRLLPIGAVKAVVVRDVASVSPITHYRVKPAALG